MHQQTGRHKPLQHQLALQPNPAMFQQSKFLSPLAQVSLSPCCSLQILFWLRSISILAAVPTCTAAQGPSIAQFSLSTCCSLQVCWAYKHSVVLQAFHALYHTDLNVLLGAPTGSGKTISAELTMLRVFRETSHLKIVYIAPLKVWALAPLFEQQSSVQKMLRGCVSLAQSSVAECYACSRILL